MLLGTITSLTVAMTVARTQLLQVQAQALVHTHGKLPCVAVIVRLGLAVLTHQQLALAVFPESEIFLDP